MSLSGSITTDELREATYKRPNSPIFAPFMINVVCNLLNNSELMQYQQPLNIEHWIGLWGGGLKLLKRCFPLWDKCVYDACKITSIDHIIWKQFLNYHNISNTKTLNNIKILQTLLSTWFETGKQNSTYGPYPTPFEQQEFQNIVIIPMGYITQAIVNLKFEPCFKSNHSDIQTFIRHQQKQQQQIMNDNGNDQYKGNNFDGNQSQNFGRYNTNNNNNFECFQEEKQIMLNNKQTCGIIYYQSTYYTIEQLQNICHYFMFNKENAPKLLFDDNNIDKNRPLYHNRLYFDGQAQELGTYDRWFGYGITTTLKQQFTLKWDFINFKKLMDNEFKPLFDHITNGRDIIVPAPNYKDLNANRSKYFDKYGQRKFRHNIGTDTANLKEKYLKYIQIKLNQLETFASSVEEINYAKMYEYENKSQTQRRTYSNSCVNDENGMRHTYEILDYSFKNIIDWCLFILCYLIYFPRKIYIALVIDNRWQDVFKMVSVILMGIGVISYLMNWYLTNICVVCFIGGIICALCGGDYFYPEMDRVKVNCNDRNGNGYGEEWNCNGRIGNGYYQNDVNSPFNYN